MKQLFLDPETNTVHNEYVPGYETLVTLEDYRESLDKYNKLEEFVKENIGLSDCALPTNYCNSCGCGKKEAFENKKGGKI